MEHNYQSSDISFPLQKIEERNMEKEVRQSFIEYSMSVITSRALPDVRDGMKPGQRRILYAMYEDNLTHDKPFRKSATTVGNVLGRYHPHGDASIGDAIVVLANKLWGEGKGYLIDGQGNYGSLYTGLPHAATRYIECRLSELARKEIFNKKTTTFVPNYDGRKEEPVYLPAKLPLYVLRSRIRIRTFRCPGSRCRANAAARHAAVTESNRQNI